MREIDMTHLVSEPETSIVFVGDFPADRTDEYRLFLVVTRFGEIMCDHALAYLVCPRDQAVIEGKLKAIRSVIGDDLVVVDLQETIPDAAAAAARLEALRSARLNTLVLGTV